MLQVWTIHAGYPRGYILNTTHNFIMGELLIRSGDYRFHFHSHKSAGEHCAKKQENKLQITKKLILHCDFSNG